MLCFMTFYQTELLKIFKKACCSCRKGNTLAQITGKSKGNLASSKFQTMSSGSCFLLMCHCMRERLASGGLRPALAAPNLGQQLAHLEDSLSRGSHVPALTLLLSTMPGQTSS